MNNFKIYKNFAFISLAAELIISFVLFGKIQNLILASDININSKSIYALILLSILIVTILFIIVIILIYQNNEEELSNEIEFIDTTLDNNENTKDELHDEIINIDNYITKIIPKETAKIDLKKYTEKILSNFAKEFDIVQGLFFVKEKESDIFNITGKYAYFGEENPKSFKLGESLSGQVAKNKTILYLNDIPENYVTILSGLGSSSPRTLVLIPLIVDDKTIGIIELASFKEFKHKFNELFEKLSAQLGKTLSNY